MRFLVVLFLVTAALAFGCVTLFIPSMYIGYNFGVGWMIAYLIVACSAYIAVAER